MSELVRHGGHIIRAALVVEQYPGGQVRQGCQAEGAALLALAYLAVEVGLSRHSQCQLSHERVKFTEGIHHQRHGILEGKCPVGVAERGVDVIAAQFFHAQQAGFEFEIALEDAGIAGADVQQGLHHRVRYMVGEVAHGNRAAKAAQVELFVVPVAHQVLVDLSQNGAVFAVDAVELLVGGLAQLRVGVTGVHHQLAAGQLVLDRVHHQPEGVAVGDAVVERVEGVGAGGVFDVDNLLLSLGQGVRLEQADFLQPVAVIAGGIQQAVGSVFRQVFPPQAEEHGAVSGIGGSLVDTRQQGQGFLILGVLREAQ